MIKIRNPKASFSYVKIKSQQDFAVCFSSMEDVVDFNWSSDYFEVCEDLSTPLNADRQQIHFRQLYPDIMADWAKYSSVLLGEIWVVRQSGQSNLLVVLEQTSPKINDILTIIDPDDISLTLRPKQILEIVLTGDNRNCQYCATGLTTSQCFYHNPATVKMDVNDERMLCGNGNGTFGKIKKEAEGIYTIDIGNDVEPIRVLPKVTGKSMHFWYRNFLNGMNWPAGIYNAGRIYCEGGAKENDGQIHLNLKLRRKDTHKKGLSIPSIQNTVVPHCKNVILEEVGGEFEDCETVEYIGENKITKTVDNRVIVYKPYKPHQYGTVLP